MTTEIKNIIQLLRDLRVCGADNGCDGCSRTEDNPACYRIRADAADAIAKLIKMSGNFEVPVEPKAEKAIPVNHPAHYNRPGSIECIDEMLEVFGAKAVMDFCLLNVWKYRYRASDKDGSKDLEKSDRYMDKYIELKAIEDRKERTIDV